MNLTSANINHNIFILSYCSERHSKKHISNSYNLQVPGHHELATCSFNQTSETEDKQ